jgi:hypothetical protein
MSGFPLKKTVSGGFDFAEIIARGCKNKNIDGFCSILFSKSIDENRNRLAIAVFEILEINCGGVAKIWTFFSFS